MFIASKIHATAVIVCTWIAALFGPDTRKLPYFPIEISRAAASNDQAHGVFVWGVISILPTLLFESFYFTNASLSEKGHITTVTSIVFGTPLFLWPAVLAIAWFDDRNHMFLHLAGVSVLLLLVMANVLASGPRMNHKLPVFVCGLILFSTSALIKVLAIV